MCATATSKELGRLLLGGTREWIPTLDELLTIVEGRVPIFIELKSMPGRDRGFAGAVASRLMSYHGPAAVMSFDPALLAEVRITEPGLPRGLVAEGDWRKGREHIRTARALELDFVSYSIDDIPNIATTGHAAAVRHAADLLDGAERSAGRQGARLRRPDHVRGVRSLIAGALNVAAQRRRLTFPA